MYDSLAQSRIDAGVTYDSKARHARKKMVLGDVKLQTFEQSPGFLRDAKGNRVNYLSPPK